MAQAASSSRIRAVPVSQATKAPRAKRTPKTPSVVDQFRVAIQPKNRIATAIGAVIGGWVPLASYTIAHQAIDRSAPIFNQVNTYFVIGALIFSALSVFSWGRQAFRSGTKAFGFVLLLEGVLTVVNVESIAWLNWSALALLMGINAVATGVNLSRREPS